MASEAPASVSQEQPARDGFWLAFALCAVLYLLPIWSFKYLPMVDLPQRAGQVWLWCHYDDPALDISRRYELHLFTPYLLAYFVARCFAYVLSVPDAMRATISLTVLALPLSMQVLLRATGSSRWWALAGFPLSFGVSFYWGLVPYMAGAPLAVLLIGLTYTYAARPAWKTGLAIGALGLALHFTHGLAWLFGVGVCAVVLALHAKGPRAFFLGLLPLAAATPLAAAWFLYTRQSGAIGGRPIEWDLGVYRAMLLPSQWADMGFGALPFAYGMLWLLAGIAVCFLSAAPRRPWKLWVPFALAVLCYFALPNQIVNTYLFFQRFALFAPICLFAAVPPVLNAARARLLHLAIAALAIAWNAPLWAHLTAFDREARTFDRVMERMDAHRRVIIFPYQNRSKVLDGPYYLHFPAWYQPEKGGEVYYNFAMMFAEPIRYRPEHYPRQPQGMEWPPLGFTWEEMNAFDYYVVRSSEDLSPRLFVNPGHDIRLVEHVEDWWLYAHAKPAPPP